MPGDNRNNHNRSSANLGNNPNIMWRNNFPPVLHMHRSLDVSHGALSETIESAHATLNQALHHQQVTPSNFNIAVASLNNLVLAIRYSFPEHINTAIDEIQTILDRVIGAEVTDNVSQRPD